MNFTELPIPEFTNAIDKIGKDWMLITVKSGDKLGTMTASWGMMGTLWNKPVCEIFIRPTRATFPLAEQETRLTLSFFDESHRDALRYLGSHSMRDGDKIAAVGFTPVTLPDGLTTFAEARETLSCRKLYADILREGSFVDPALLSNYRQNDYHTFYFLEIEKIWKKN